MTSEEELERLCDLVLKLGEDAPFTEEEATAAIEELRKAGVETDLMRENHDE